MHETTFGAFSRISWLPLDMPNPTVLDQFRQIAVRQGAEIQDIKDPLWIQSIEARLPFRIPNLYRDILSTFAFTPFDFNGVSFFANLGNSMDREDISCRIFLDKAIQDALFAQKLFQIGNPIDASYDPICIQCSSKKTQDGAIIRVDHESVLCHHKVKIVQILSPSFSQLIDFHK